MTAERWVTPLDQRLLTELDRTPNVVRAAQVLGISRDRAVYRLQRLARLYGRPATLGRRGGGGVGATTLTPFGRSLLHAGAGRRPGTNRWAGRYRARPSPHIDLGPGRRLEVAFRAKPDTLVTVEVEPESFLIARGTFESSARNVLPARLTDLRSLRSGRVEVRADWNGTPIRATLTPGSVRRLGLAPGRRAYFYLKAVAVRRA